MKSLAILYLGPKSGTCLRRAVALQRLGHRLQHIAPRELLPRSPWVDRITWRCGGDWFQRRILSGLRPALAGHRYDLAYVNNGEYVTPAVIELLRTHAPTVISYSIDDPLGPRDGARSRAYRSSVPHYDLCVVMRAVNVEEARLRGARDVMRVFMSADEQEHAPLQLTAALQARWSCDVLFVGTWFPERGVFLSQLLDHGVPVVIQGENWHKAPEWPRLRAHWRGGQIEGRDYVAAIQCAKIGIGMLSKGNRDQHTTRSTEIPAIGSVLCAERTQEHREMFVEGEEAMFWDDAAECAAICRALLADEPRRARIAAAGRARTLANGNFNEPVLSSIVDRALHPRPRT